MNLAIITGNLGNDPELRYTQNQKPVATISVATTSFKKAADGKSEKETEWHRCVLWNQTAENAAKYLKKGSKVALQGAIKTRSWEDQQGQKRYSTEIQVNQIEFLDPKQESKPASRVDPNDPDAPF